MTLLYRLGNIYANDEGGYKIETNEQTHISCQILATDNEEVKSLQVFVNDELVITDRNGVITVPDEYL